MTDPLRWPNNQREFRDETAELADESIRVLQAFLYPAHPPEQEEIRLVAIALENNLEILRLMQQAGSEVIVQGMEPNPAMLRTAVPLRF